VTREELHKLVCSQPMRTVARSMGNSDVQGFGVSKIKLDKCQPSHLKIIKLPTRAFAALTIETRGLNHLPLAVGLPRHTHIGFDATHFGGEILRFIK
jgi:hypothetical protein